MLVIKKINNNVALCRDDNKKELVAIGTGIGFPKTPYVLNDLSKISLTFYRVSVQTMGLLKTIPEATIIVSSTIVDKARKVLGKEFSENVVFSLADHINFAIERSKKNEVFDFSLSYDIKHLYPTEFKVGQQALKIIKKNLHYKLPDSEAVAVAMHIINAEEDGKSETKIKDEHIINDIVVIIDSSFKITINRETFSYQRFIVHLRYFLNRVKEHNQITDNSSKSLLADMVKKQPKIYECVEEISKYIATCFKEKVSKDEIFYLMVYVNRIVGGRNDE